MDMHQNIPSPQLEEALEESHRKIQQLQAEIQRIEDKNRTSSTGSTNALRESEERYHKMIEEVEDYAILLLDIDGRIQNWNKGAEKIKGYAEEEVMGRHFRIFYPAQDQQEQLPERLIKEAKEKGKAIHEGWRVRKDGSYFWGSIVITALHDDEGNILAFSKVTRDLSERKIAEDKMQNYTRQLEFQNSQLQQFAYAAAHDMKEPLRKIQFYISAIKSSMETSPDKTEYYLHNCTTAAKRMQALIEDILAFAKVSEHSPAIEPVDLTQVWQDSVNFYSEAIEETGAKVERDSLPVINGILFQIRQLFYNLLSNALKYRHPERAPRISIGCEKISRTVPGFDHTQSYPFYKLSIADNGIGFDPAYQERIFEMFERLHTRDNYSGTGIGLAICKKIAENHGGIIEAFGKTGEGAMFNIYLPA